MKEIMEPENARHFSQLPDEALINLNMALWLFGGISRSKWYEGIRQGKYPRQVKIDRASRWRVGDIRTVLNNLPSAI